MPRVLRCAALSHPSNEASHQSSFVIIQLLNFNAEVLKEALAKIEDTARPSIVRIGSQSIIVCIFWAGTVVLVGETVIKLTYALSACYL